MNRNFYIYTFVLTVLIWLIPGTLFADYNVDTTFTTYYGARHFAEYPLINQKDEWKDQGAALVNVRLTPTLAYEDNFQYDYLMDVTVNKRFEEDKTELTFYETYLDLLFYDTYGLKMGLIKVDYGTNSYFHPLQIIEFVPEIRDLYNRQFIGTTDLGYRGVPSLRAKARVPEFIDDLSITVTQSEVFLGLDVTSSSGNVDINPNQSNKERARYEKRVYSITDVSFIYRNLNVNILGGYMRERGPVWGLSASYLFPFEIVGYVEALHRTESYRPRVEDGEYLEYKQDNYYNVATGLNFQFRDPIFYNSISINAEYFYYGEGLNPSQYEEARSFLKYRGNLRHFSDLVVRERNMINYGMLSMSYTMPERRLTFKDQVIVTGHGPDDVLYYNQFIIQKSYDAIILSLTLLHNVGPKDDKILFQGNDQGVFVNASVEM